MKPNHAHFLFEHPKCSYQSDFGQKGEKSTPGDNHEQKVKNIEHIELETCEDFFEIFVEGCMFKPMPIIIS